MFNLFGKKNNETKVIDKVWIASADKLQACADLLQQNPAVVFVAWFNDTVTKLSAFLEQRGLKGKVILYKQATSEQADNIVFIEHYPLIEKEKELYEKLQLKQATFYIALDQPLYKQFGSDKIVAILTQFGMNKNECIEHSMITSSIKKAQEKIASKVTIDQSANSQEEWVRKNVETSL